MDTKSAGIDRQVEALFAEISPQHGQLCRNPVTGGNFLYGVDPIAPQKAEACRALLAREWFGRCGPKDAPHLPLSDIELEDLKYTDPLRHIVSYFAFSLWSNGWDFDSHPSFENFARGVLASEHAPDFVKADKALCKRYPPRRLLGLGRGLSWKRCH